MVESYTKKYVNIYFFQGLSIILGFVSIFIVLPYISSNKDLYGVYAICSSLTIYFSYADLGFGAAGQKFAVESYVRNDRDEEMQIVGFTTFVFLVFMSFISLLILLLSAQPDLLLKGIEANNVEVARWLLIILALSSPVFAMNRALTVIYSIRLEDYKFQQIQIVCNIIKILSVFYFFTNGRYMLVPYYFFFNVMGFVSTIWALIYVKRKYDYNIFQLVKNIKFNHTVFFKIKGLAFAGLISMICWILYYELDQIAISLLFGVKAVATYAIAFSILTYFRTYFGVIFAPLTARFNYFIGDGNKQGLDEHLRRVCCFFFPFVVMPIMAVVIFADSFYMYEALDKKKQILYSLNIRNLNNAETEETYAKVVKSEKSVNEGRGTIYTCNIDGKTKYVFTVKGMGLWGGIGGYISVNDDKNTVYGAYFTHEGETAGLGAEIKDNQSWQEKFQGKKLFKDGVTNEIALSVKKKVEDPVTQVDAVTGATLTSNGVAEMLMDKDKGLGQYLDFLNQK